MSSFAETHPPQWSDLWAELDAYVVWWLCTRSAKTCAECDAASHRHITTLGAWVQKSKLHATSQKQEHPGEDAWDVLRSGVSARVNLKTRRCQCARDLKAFLLTLQRWSTSKQVLRSEEGADGLCLLPYDFVESPWEGIRWNGDDPVEALWETDRGAHVHPTMTMLETILYDGTELVMCGAPAACVQLSSLATLRDVLQAVSERQRSTPLPASNNSFMGIAGADPTRQTMHFACSALGNCASCDMSVGRVNFSAETLTGRSWSKTEVALSLSLPLEQLSVMSQLCRANISLSGLSNVDYDIKSALAKAAFRCAEKRVSVAVLDDARTILEGFTDGRKVVAALRKLSSKMYATTGACLDRPFCWRAELHALVTALSDWSCDATEALTHADIGTEEETPYTNNDCGHIHMIK